MPIVANYSCQSGYTLDPSGTTCTSPGNSSIPSKSASGPPPTESDGSSCSACTDPINPAIGTTYELQTDYVGAGSFPLTVERHYNSSATALSTNLGSHWRENYDRSVILVSNSSVQAASVYRPDGKIYSFTLTNGVWTPDFDIKGTLTELVDSTGTLTGWKYVNENDETETYDAAGELTSIANRAGFTQTLTYTANLLASVTDASGRQLIFTHDANGRVATMTDPSGGLYKYAYDAAGNLSTVTYPDGKVRTYLFAEAAHVSATPNAGVSYVSSLTGIVDENGNRYATWNYDAQGRAYSSEHGVGIDKVVLTYNADGTTTAADSLGASHTYGFGIVLGVPHNTSLVDRRGTMSRSYDANGNLSSRTDFNGNVTTWQYDLTRNLVTGRTDASGTPLARTVTTQWDPNFRLPTVISEPGRTTSNTYDPATGNLLSRSVTDIASNVTRTWTYAYTTSSDNTLPNLLKSIDGPRTDVQDVTTFTYYPNGDLDTVTDALGHVTTFTSYDGAGRPLSVTDPNGVVTVLAYTPRGWLASRKVGALTTAYAYDGVGDVTRVTLP
ncbi:MAG: hypothetical protein B7X10_00885, partial [Burkholderiales bacterium 21-58-4]